MWTIDQRVRDELAAFLKALPPLPTDRAGLAREVAPLLLADVEVAIREQPAIKDRLIRMPALRFAVAELLLGADPCLHGEFSAEELMIHLAEVARRRPGR